MTGQLSIQNTGSYAGLSKVRNISDVPYIFEMGIGNDATRGASASLRLLNDSNEELGRIDAWANGEVTYKNKDTGYLPFPRIATGSYTGTGASGSSNKNSLTFDFVPKFVIIAGGSTFGILVNPLSIADVFIMNAYNNTSNSSIHGIALTWNEKTVSWYNDTTNGQTRQLNQSNITYTYYALG